MLSILQKGTETCIGGDDNGEVANKGVENSPAMDRRIFVSLTLEQLRGKLSRQAEVLMRSLE